MLRHASLFSGIGGFDLAATWMNWQNVFSCEKDPFCRKILNFYWPETKQYENIFQFDADEYRHTIDVLSGGFPCQPFSSAGRRKGKEDDRYLWPETRRVITEVRPEWIVLENVAGLFTILEPESLSEMEIKAVELFCSDDKQEASTTIVRLQRRVIGSIISEIGSAGYVLPKMEDGTPIVLCIPACAVNAPHRRDRTWFVAHAEHSADRAHGNQPGYAASDRTDGKGREAKAAFHKGRPDHDCRPERPHSDSDSDGQYSSDRKNEIFTGKRWQHAQHDTEPVDSHAANSGNIGNSVSEFKPAWCSEIPGWNDWPSQPPVCGRDDGVSRELDGTTFPKWRSESIKAYGNAIVPQVAYEIFQAIAAVHRKP
jgi:DNA (cytosine-5)-methyltransferase 1